MKAKTEGLINYIELNLGLISTGWSHLIESSGDSFQIARFNNKPMTGAVTFSTLGISKSVLPQYKGKSIRQELIFCCNRPFANWDIPELLMVVGEELLTHKKAFMRGQVLGHAGPLFPKSTLDALYCSVPVYFPESLHEYKDTDPITVFIWLIPITKEEARFIEERGWDDFEDLLVKRDPDLLDLKRSSIIDS